MIELRLLGTLDIRDAAGGTTARSILAQPKRLALLAYLAMATPRGAHRRDRLLSLFWPESSEERARNSLSQALFNIRRSLGEDAIIGSLEDIQIGETVWCDAVAFVEAATGGDVERALSLYQGELLPAFHVDGCSEFEHWADAERDQLRRMAVAAALGHAAEKEHSGNSVAAVELLRRVVAWTPYDEQAVHRLVSLLAQLGDRPGALQEYERFTELLASELAIEPGAALQQLAAEVRASTPTSFAPPLLGLPARQAVPEQTANPKSRSPKRRVATVALAGLAVLIAARFFIPSASVRQSNADASASPLDSRRVLVAAFENRTGDVSLDPLGYMAADWIAQGLARTGLARVVPFSTVVQETPHLKADAVAPEVAGPAANRQFARRIGAGVLVAGNYYHTGDAIVFQAQVIDVASGEVLRAIEEVRGSAKHPAVAAEQLQKRALGALATLFDERLESWPDPGGQPTSLEAYQLFAEGMDVFIAASREFGTPAFAQQNVIAAAKFKAAARLDSLFMTPLLWAGFAYSNAGDTTAARAVINTLEQRPLSPWARAVVSIQAAWLAHDYERFYDAARMLAELSPDSEWLFKFGLAAYLTNRPHAALAALQRVDPDRGWIKGWNSYWHLRAEVQHILGNHSAALADVRQGLQHNPEDRWLRTQELWALAALGDSAALIEHVAPRLDAGNTFTLWELNTTVEELLGHRDAAVATRVLTRLLPAARALAARDSTPATRGELARLLQRAGSATDGAALLRQVTLARPDMAEYRVRYAVVEAQLGNRGPAHEVLQWLSTLDREALMQVMPVRQIPYWGSPDGWLALSQARIAAQLGEQDRAIQFLQTATRRGLNHVYLHLHDDPDFEPLRQRAEFQNLLRVRD